MIFVGFIKHHLLYALKLDQRVATLARTPCSPPFNTSGLSLPAHGVLLPLSMNHVHKFKLSHHQSAELARPQAQLWCNHGHEKDHQVLFAVKLQTIDFTPCSSFIRGCLVGLVARKAQPNLTSSSSSRARCARHTPPKRPVQSRNNLRDGEEKEPTVRPSTLEREINPLPVTAHIVQMRQRHFQFIAVGSAAGGGKKDRRMTLRSCAGESAHSSDDGRNIKASRMLCTSSTTCSPHDFAS